MLKLLHVPQKRCRRVALLVLCGELLVTDGVHRARKVPNVTLKRLTTILPQRHRWLAVC